MLTRFPWISVSAALFLLGVAAAALGTADVAAQSAGPGGPPPVASMGGGLVAAAALVLAAVILAPHLVPVFSHPMTALIDRIYFSDGNHSDVPPLTLRLARSYARDYRYEEALDEYAFQLERHPQELDAWREALEIARRTRDPAILPKWQKLARRAVRDRVEQARLGLG